MVRGVRGYVLAGGRSSRMGQDKALVTLGGKTLLERALATMRGVTDDVVVVGAERGGEREGEFVRWVEDVHGLCGPLGGIEAALGDLAGRENPASAGRRAEWACFLPVDMPLLPPGLYRALVAEWVGAGAGVGFCDVDGRAQPLVSVLEAGVRPHVEAALREGRLRVTPVLEAAAEGMARPGVGTIESGHGGMKRTAVSAETDVWVGERIDWKPSDAEWARRRLWFANVNTPEDLDEARQFERDLE